MLEAEQMPLLGRGVWCQESCVLRPLASREGLRALRLLGGSLWASWTGVTWQECFWMSTCRSVVNREASIGSSPEPRPPPRPPPQLSGQERSPTTLMGIWVPGRRAAAPGSSR